MRGGKLPVIAYSCDDKTKLSEGELLTHGQRDRRQHRHDQAEGGVRQRRRRAVAGPVRERAAADRHADRTCRRCPAPRCSAGRTGSMSSWSSRTARSAVQPVEVAQDDGKIAVIGSAACSGGETVVVGRAVAADQRHQGRGDPSRSRRELRAHADEHLDPLHPAAGRDVAADGGDPADRHRRLPAAARGAAAAGRVPDHPGDRAASRAPARRPWPPPWPSRSSGSSRRSPAWRR